MSSCFFCALPAQSDSADVSLAQIDELIVQTDYNRALDELSGYIKKYPAEFDRAQLRIDRIMHARQAYNDLANELIDVMQREPENDEKKLQIIARLESLEKHPTEKNLVFIRQAKIAAQFTYFRAQFSRIMDADADLVRTGQYPAAAAKCAEGFVLYRADFDEKKYGNEITEPVRRSLDAITAAVTRFPELQTACSSASAAFLAATTAGDPVAARTAFGRVQTSFADFAAARNRVTAAGNSLQTVFAGLQQNDPDLTEASFLAFARRFTLGRLNDQGSGIAGAFDTSWNVMMESVKQAVYQEIRAEIARCTRDVSGDQSLFAPPALHESSRQALATARLFAVIGKDVADLDGRAGIISSQNYGSSMAFIERMTGDALKLRFDAVQRVASLTESVPDDQLLSVATSCAAVYQDAVAALHDPWFTSAAGSNDDAGLSWKEALSLYMVLCTKTASQAQAAGITAWSQLARFYAGQGSSALAGCTVRYTEADLLLTGGTKRYPSACVNAVLKLQTDVRALQSYYAAALETLGAGVPVAGTSDQFTRGRISVQSTLDGLASVLHNAAALESKARAQILLAERARNEAVLRYTEAVTALNAGKFDEARDGLQRSRVKYNESLSYQDSDQLRSESDAALEKLGADVARRENEIIVREVRGLKTNAKNAYYNGNFELAEKLLLQARSRWAVTNIDDDPETANLLALVSTALSMKTGRVIPPTAPLYPEMSQILNIANQYYEQGSQLMKQGKTEEGREVLNQAKAKLRTLQLVYPLNQDAGLLSLKIDQVINPAAFSSVFAQKIAAAKNNYTVPSKRQTAYTDLLDLYQINPSYPGLKQLIYDVEIEIGVRQKPVDTTALTQSRLLTAEAQKLYDGAGRDEVKLRAALAKLNDAIRLNPENDGAMVLKDRIQTAVGGQAAVVLSSTDESMYQQAIQELQKNNIVGANALVEQLLQKAANRRSAKILDLQKKVKALL
jgi:hypothetical protein